MVEPLWLQEAVVAAIHSRQLAEHGGLDGVRDPGMLSSALARPKNAFVYSQPKPDIPSLAAAYAFGIIRNHPFVDGNKRTAYVLCRTFLKLNGQDIDASDVDKYQTFLAVAEGKIDESQLADWIHSKLA
jgi:death-on-curing protein